MAEYRYYLIPDAMTRAFPEQFGKQTPTEFFDNIADLEKRYHQLREMPYNNERTWNERTRFPYARLVVGVVRQNPDGAVAIIQVRNGVNYLCDDYRGPYADRSDAQIPQMAKKLVEVIGVDRVRPHTYTQRDGYTWVQVEKDMHITATALMAGLIYLCVKYSKHRLMPQKEYGSARWGGPEDIAPFLDEDAQNNLPLTASESLSLSPKMKVTANDNYNRNKNVIVFGPSGSGKSYSVAGPQLLQFNSNYVLSDPKGELLQEYGNVLLSQGYKVKVFNLKDRDKSDHYNLFAYIKNEDDILVVTKNLVKNLKEDPTAKSTADPIWEEGMTALLEALIGYVFYELEPEERNMNSVMTLLLMLESQGDGPNSVSQLDLLFDDLSINKPNSFAAKQYKLYKMAPGKTAQSINVSLGLRMSAFNIPSIANICADDTIDLRELGSEKKVALFVVTPDTTTAYNFLAAVMFQQCFQILVDIADHRPDKRLPRHLRFLLDEFPNIGMIPDFQILISTIRSRDIACTLIYQSLNQLKSQYKDDWATIYENCDSMIVLGAGGNPENLEFFSKALGKATIEVMNTSENKGSQGSYTKSYQALGRELMTPEEIRTMPRNWCLLMISGVAPFYSRKYNLKDHPNYHLVEAEGGKPFDYDRRAEQSFADFISNVKDVKTVKLCAENNN